MNNSDDYYTKDDVMLLTGKSSVTVSAMKNKVKTYVLGNRTIYLREDINNIIEDSFSNESKELAVAIAMSHIRNHNINLDDWYTISDVTRILGITRERVYQVSSVRGKNKIQAVYYSGIWLFNKNDIYKIQKQST